MPVKPKRRRKHGPLKPVTVKTPVGVIRRRADVAFFELDIRIGAPPERVWRALTAEIAAWWLPDFLCAPGSTGIKFEAWPGGRLYEESTSGGGLVWFNVAALTPPSSLHLAGHIIPPYGGPATTLLYLAIDKAPHGTLLKVHNAIFGYVSKGQLTNTVDGWRQLFAEGLKPYAERPIVNSREPLLAGAASQR